MNKAKTDRTDRMITKAGYAELQAQIKELEGPARIEVAARIKEARDFGDISENAEYEAAKNDQAMLETRIAQLRQRLARAEIVDTRRRSTTVGVGSKVRFKDKHGEHDMQIVGHGEADIAGGKMSAASPIGTALLGAKAGEEIKVKMPNGSSRKVTILKVS